MASLKSQTWGQLIELKSNCYVANSKLWCTQIGMVLMLTHHSSSTFELYVAIHSHIWTQINEPIFCHTLRLSLCYAILYNKHVNYLQLISRMSQQQPKKVYVNIFWPLLEIREFGACYNTSLLLHTSLPSILHNHQMHQQDYYRQEDHCSLFIRLLEEELLQR